MHEPQVRIPRENTFPREIIIELKKITLKPYKGSQTIIRTETGILEWKSRYPQDGLRRIGLRLEKGHDLLHKLEQAFKKLVDPKLAASNLKNSFI